MNRWLRQTIITVLCIAALAESASAISSTIVISQIYSGVPTIPSEPPLSRSDYIELFNRGSAAVNIDGWSIQVASQSETGWTIVRLSGSIAPGQYFLIRGATNAGGVVALPSVEASGDLRLDPLGGRIALVENANPLSGPCPVVLDFFSYGSNPCSNNQPALNQLTAPVRLGGGCVETDGLDFVSLAPFPRNTSTPRNVCGVTATPRDFTVNTNGGVSLETLGSAGSLSIGYVRVQPSGANVSPAGFAIFSQRQGSTVISEATVPAAPLIRSGYLYVDVNGPVNTGVAIANPSGQDASISFSFYDSNRGILTHFGSLAVPANGQLARFVNELPYALLTPAQGTLAFTSDVPVAVIALRGRTNERGEFLITTTPVIDAAAPLSTADAYLAHYAVGGGWRTETILINTSSKPVNGTMEFRNAAGNPVALRVGTESVSSFPYSLIEGASTKFNLNSVSGDLTVGSIRIAPAAGTTAPVALAVFSYTRNNVTVSEAGLVSLSGTRFRTYVEQSGTPGANGSVLPGIALANTTSQSATVDLELTRLDGTSTGLRTSVSIPPSGQVSKFLNELFPTLAAPFRGIIRATSTVSFTLIGLRARYNERGDFLITTVPPADESQAATSAESLFPHFADSGGYTTQFILFGRAGQPSAGTLRSFTPGGQPLALEFR